MQEAKQRIILTTETTFGNVPCGSRFRVPEYGIDGEYLKAGKHWAIPYQRLLKGESNPKCIVSPDWVTVWLIEEYFVSVDVELAVGLD